MVGDGTANLPASRPRPQTRRFRDLLMAHPSTWSASMGVSEWWLAVQGKEPDQVLAVVEVLVG